MTPVLMRDGTQGEISTAGLANLRQHLDEMVEVETRATGPTRAGGG